jgi:hypothetical protein
VYFLNGGVASITTVLQDGTMVEVATIGAEGFVGTAACNAMHAVQQRCARWLLMSHDRMHERDFHLSHEFLAIMLGVQRPTVSVVAAALQSAGLIHYRHGRVRVRDRRGLEAASCECYFIVREQFDRLRQ